MALNRQKFTSQADPVLLSEVRRLAEQQGRPFQSALEEAMREWLERRQHEAPRTHVLTHFQNSVERNEGLYRRLAQ